MDVCLKTGITIGEKTFPNRMVYQPMEGCDCNTDGSPSERTGKKYLAEAAGGAGTIWFEACAVCPEGRTGVRQMRITEENLPSFRILLEKVRAVAKEKCGIRPICILQLTHSGRQSIHPMIVYRHPIYEEKRPVTDGAIVTDEYLDTLPALYKKAAFLAARAGFDGVDVKSCHGYLLQELLSAFTRPGRYGGSFENRTRLYFECLRAVKEALPKDMLLTARLSVSDMIPKPYGFGTDEKGNLDLTEPDRLIEKMHKEGISILNVTVGNPYYNPHVNRPFRKGPYTPPESAETGLLRFETIEKHLKERFPTLYIVASGLSYYREDLFVRSEKLLSDGMCDFVGFGRMSLAYPNVYRDYENGCFSPQKCCISCSRCTELMRHGCISGCAVFNPYYKKLYEEAVLCKKSPS